MEKPIRWEMPHDINEIFRESLEAYTDRRISEDGVPPEVYARTERLARLGASLPLIAKALGISKTKLEYLKKEEGERSDPMLVAAFDRGTAYHELSILVGQDEVMRSGDSRMLVFKGKAQLGQREAVTVSGDESAPLQVATSVSLREIHGSLLGLRKI